MMELYVSFYGRLNDVARSELSGNYSVNIFGIAINSTDTKKLHEKYEK